MKKSVLVLLLGVIIATGTLFADGSHPDKLGIGVLWRNGLDWDSGTFSAGGAALSLKLPNLPIYWGINLGFGDGWFSVGASGDYYLVGGNIAGNVLFGYIGLGGYLGLTIGDNASLGFGARLPLGLSVQFIDRLLELFVEIAPSIGLGIRTGGDGGMFPDGGFYTGIGIRLWL